MFLEKIKFNKLFVVVILAMFTINACKDDDTETADNQALFSEMQDALGGKSNIDNATTYNTNQRASPLNFRKTPNLSMEK